MSSATLVAPKRRTLSSFLNYEIGVIPLPYFIVIAIIVFLSAHLGYLPKTMIGGLAVIMTIGMSQEGGDLVCLFLEGQQFGLAFDVNDSTWEGVTYKGASASFIRTHCVLLCGGNRRAECDHVCRAE
ncbi:hypothetical protein [Pseudomonas citri]|uniref:hypothetical protein n=1 Tax=Pseudomonas citri TaxID=2978349 RepID=UPI0021B6B48E|nr:hypothetical protein [Pseudomonas citri]